MFRCIFFLRGFKIGVFGGYSRRRRRFVQRAAKPCVSCLLSCHGGVFLPDVFSFTTLLGTKSDSDTAWRRAIVVLEQMEEIYRGVDGPGPGHEKNPWGVGGGSSF